MYDYYEPIPEVPQEGGEEEREQEPLVVQEQQQQQQEQQQQSDGTSSKVGTFLWRGFLGGFAVACFLFGIYMVSFYLRTIVQNKLNAWDMTNKGMYHADRFDSNLFLSIHLVGGTYMMIFGPLQFVPAIRRNPKWMPFHRWNGRFTAWGSILTALGGMYYVGAVGVTTVSITGQQGNWTTMAFGLCMLICGFQTYRHAAYSKDIHLHKLWAYRVAGVCFGNIFVRVYLLWVFLFLDANSPVTKFAVDLVGYIFFLPFVWLAGKVWKREQDDKAVPSVTFLSLMAFLVVLFLVGAAMVFVFTWLPFITMKSLDQEVQDL